MEFKEILENLLKADERLVDSNKELSIAKIKELVNKNDSELIKLLLQKPEIKEKFFLNVEDVLIFKHNEFKFFLDENKIDNSYTAFENKIGLRNKSRLINEYSDVVLNFPYKDCVLEGGQSTEEGLDEYYEYDEKAKEFKLKQTKRKEIFFNEILAQDEIDRLLEPKAFTNITKYPKDGKEAFKNFNRNSEGTITDNLIIKGNNLLALHSLKKEFAGKIKLIYIDPPYNTGNDSFNYNDAFNHSTWLTFMKNRLEVARELLKEDGVIFVQCDDNEQPYLKVLMDEVFGRDNFINCIIPEMSNLSGNKIEHAIQGRKFPKIKEFILLYAKAKSTYKLKIPKNPKNEWDDEYNIILPDLCENEYSKIQEYIESKNEVKLTEIISKQKIESLHKYITDQKITDAENWKFDNSYRILASKPNTAIRSQALKMKFENEIAILKNSRGDLKIIRTDFNKETETARIELVFARKNLNTFLGDIWFNITTTGGVAKEGGVSLKNGKKPEQLLEIIIKSATEHKDIVLDFHLGSGTTAAVAHKMGRQYIGIEQLDYAENDSVVRLQNVINGDKTGISKSVNWQSGGSFVYLELKKWNEEAKEKIIACENLEDIEKLLSELSDKYFLNYNVKFKEFQETIIKDDKFRNLDLDKQKEMICKMLDLNQLYVNLSEINDKKYDLVDADIQLTKNFYKEI